MLYFESLILKHSSSRKGVVFKIEDYNHKLFHYHEGEIKMVKKLKLSMYLGIAVILLTGVTNANKNKCKVCRELPSRQELSKALKEVVQEVNTSGVGLSTEMWLTVVNRDGIVCNVLFSGKKRDDQWPGSRVISAQKANTANAFSLPNLALSTANLYAAVQPGGSLFGLQESNPVNALVAYRGNSMNYGQMWDPLKGTKIGGVNVFGGGLALYNGDGKIVGAIGVSGNTSCSDHIIAWKVRDAIGFDNVPAGVSAANDDNIILDMAEDSNGHLKSASGFGHPICGFKEEDMANELSETNPTGPND